MRENGGKGLYKDLGELYTSLFAGLHFKPAGRMKCHLNGVHNQSFFPPSMLAIRRLITQAHTHPSPTHKQVINI